MESNLSLVGSFITTLLATSDCGHLLRFGIVIAPSRALTMHLQRRSAAARFPSKLIRKAVQHLQATVSVPWNYGCVELARGHAPLVPSHAEVLELQGTGGTSCFRQRLFPVRLVGLIFIQAME
jgi:hypothetical protein